MTVVSGKDHAELSFEERNGYLYVFASGPRDTVPLSMALWSVAVAECRKRGFQRLLLEDRFPNEITVTEMFELVNALVALAVPGLKVVYIDQNPDHNGMAGFAENVAVNRGVDCRVFNRIADAEAWFHS